MKAIIASPTMRNLMSMAERVARSNATVLILGESGSGKEVLARAIHHFSNRSQKPWVDLNCGALPEHLIESELFGYDRGAFSGANNNKAGLFELAHQGTIFLDEIAELEMKMQVKLLRVLDGVPYYRLGGVKKVAVDVRIVAAHQSGTGKGCGGRTFPVGTCTIGLPRSRCGCLRCAIARKISSPWRSIFWPSTILVYAFLLRRLAF